MQGNEKLICILALRKIHLLKMKNSNIIKNFKNLIGEQNVLTSEWAKSPYSKGWRYGNGKALAVLKPGKLFEIWKILQICVQQDFIVITHNC